MYDSPKLVRYGTFRELTAGGGSNANVDNASVFDHTEFCISLQGTNYLCVSV